MKTKKAASNKAVREASQADNKMLSTIKKLRALSEKQSKLPSAEEQRAKELHILYWNFFNNWNHVNKYLLILAELGGSNVSIDDIEGILLDMDDRLYTIRKAAARVFEIGGIVEDETRDDLKRAAEEAAKKAA